MGMQQGISRDDKVTQTDEGTLTARESLRSETRDKHAALDALLGELHPFASCERYSIYLAGMRGLYAAFGDALDRCARSAQLAPRQREMITAIDADLASCNASENEPAAAPVSQFTDSAAWGAAYVLEGSAMGAQMLVRTARERLSAEVTIHFLTALAGEGVSRFRAFCAAMEAANVDADEAVAAAERVFKHATEWYRRRLAEMTTGAGPAGDQVAT